MSIVSSLCPSRKLLITAYEVWDKFRGNPKLKPELKIIQYIAPLNKVALDIGSLHGIFIIPLLRYSSRVIAFEPNPKKIHFLNNLYHKNKKVSILNYALSETKGNTFLRIPHINPKTDDGLGTIDTMNFRSDLLYNEYEVQKDTLDNHSFSEIGIVKIDVEGHEFSVLKGGLSFFTEQLPNVIIESEERHHPGAPLKVIDFFLNLGYKGYFILGRDVKDISLFKPSLHQRLEGIDFSKPLYDSPYGYNFFFISPKYQFMTFPIKL